MQTSVVARLLSVSAILCLLPTSNIVVVTLNSSSDLDILYRPQRTAATPGELKIIAARAVDTEIEERFSCLTALTLPLQGMRANNCTNLLSHNAETVNMV